MKVVDQEVQGISEHGLVVPREFEVNNAQSWSQVRLVYERKNGSGE